MKKFFSTFIFCFLVWILLAGISPPELILGVAISIVLAILIAKFTDISISWKTPVQIVLFTVLYIPVFLYELVKSNIDVLFRVLNPKLPINPGFVKVKSEIKGKLGKLILANSITLTPGTISVDADDEGIFVHWINVQGSSEEEYSEKIAGKFERLLRKVVS
ncbi:MAG: Na+/H+ antiporter subunit E [Clostridiales bacterium]|nr:Na+/H+ antiporter subunit E [Clostridiales bacterium]